MQIFVRVRVRERRKKQGYAWLETPLGLSIPIFKFHIKTNTTHKFIENTRGKNIGNVDIC